MIMFSFFITALLTLVIISLGNVFMLLGFGGLEILKPIRSYLQ